ncbi:hypothetical protein HZH68_005174 [Vespula germanica]|uniref:Uncharacterized protein n=1 Tax=Vespula germanica TaxID=30212 RepID=A0A834KFR3_VESGE|nr:hypothetical protein HZH68_005174 [Vespula germanica]
MASDGLSQQKDLLQAHFSFREPFGTSYESRIFSHPFHSSFETRISARMTRKKAGLTERYEKRKVSVLEEESRKGDLLLNSPNCPRKILGERRILVGASTNLHEL